MARLASVKKPAQNASLSPSIRTGEGLRDVLFDELDALRSGAGDRRRALAVATLAQQIILTVKTEIDYQRHLALLGTKANGVGYDTTSVRTIKLGSDATP